VQQQLDAISRRYGVFTSSQVNVTHKGAAGVAMIRAMMDRLRASPPPTVGGDTVLAVADYETRLRTELSTRATTPVTLPRSNVLTYELASGSRIIARPSGTEPKAKFYFDVREEVRGDEDVSAAAARAAAAMKKLADAFTALASPVPPA
jgi:phosphomannomutase